MAPRNFKNLSISVSNSGSVSDSDSDSTVKAGSVADSDSTVKAESGAKPNSTHRLGMWLGTKIPVAPSYRPRPDFNPTTTRACSPTLPIPVMASVSTSLSRVASTPTAMPKAPSAPPAELSKAEQLFNMIHLYFYNEVRPLCTQFLHNPPSEKRAFKTQYEELSDALSVGVLYELITLDTEGDAALHNKRKSAARVVKDLIYAMEDVAMEKATFYEKEAADHLEEMTRLADEIALREEMAANGMTIPVQIEGWDLAGEMKIRLSYPQKKDDQKKDDE